jgi:hypothetical protein
MMVDLSPREIAYLTVLMGRAELTVDSESKFSSLDLYDRFYDLTLDDTQALMYRQALELEQSLGTTKNSG